MRERELKKECIDVAREMKQTQRGREGDETEAESTETKWVRRNVRRVFWRFEWNWAEVGLVLSKTVRSGFFFFFFNFGLNRLFRPIRPIQADMADSGPSWPDSAGVDTCRSCVGSHWRASVKTTWDPRGPTRPNARAAASPARRRVPPRQTRVRHLRCRVRAS